MNKIIKLTDKNYIKCFDSKSTSIRLGVKDFRVGSSTIENVETGNSMDCTITKVELMKVSNLNDFHAIRDGFSSLKSLINELKNCYGDLGKDDHITRVTFKTKYN